MKYTLLLLVNTATAFSQHLNDSLVSKVENGLTLPMVLAINETIELKNIYDELQTRKVNGVSIAVINDHKIEWAKT